jgi:hypothetical protein
MIRSFAGRTRFPGAFCIAAGMIAFPSKGVKPGGENRFYDEPAIAALTVV